jgi:hypothetical protein
MLSSFFSSLAFLQVEGLDDSVVYPVREESSGQRGIDSSLVGDFYTPL